MGRQSVHWAGRGEEMPTWQLKGGARRDATAEWGAGLLAQEEAIRMGPASGGETMGSRSFVCVCERSGVRGRRVVCVQCYRLCL